MRERAEGAVGQVTARPMRSGNRCVDEERRKSLKDVKSLTH